jgi:uncharacterized protein
MSVLATAVDTLTNPVLLFFALGAIAGWLRSDLDIPAPVGKAIALYLMVAIGFRGGVELALHPITTSILATAVFAIALSLLMPLLAYALLRAAAGVEPTTASAVAAAYGSVSVVTFVTAEALLSAAGVPFGGHFVAILALMETPAIVTGLVLASRASAGQRLGQLLRGPVLREALVSGSVLLLLGGLAIGWITGQRGMDSLGIVLVTPFQGVLAIFLLEVGLLVVRRLRESQALRPRVIAFGLYMPLIGAVLGLLAARALGLPPGEGTLLAVLAASASYIAVPAAMRHALPQADPSVYVTLALGVTFPFNILIGIPLYQAVATAILGAP